MLNTTNSNAVNSASLKATKKALTQLIDETAVMAAMFQSMKQAAQETSLPLDEASMAECEELFSKINCLLYRQDADLKHLQHLQITSAKAKIEYAKIKRGHLANPQSNIFNVAV